MASLRTHLRVAASAFVLLAACGGEKPVDAEAASRSRDPAVAGPVLFAQVRRAASDPDLLLKVLVPSLAARIRAQVETQLEGFRKDPERAARVQARLGLRRSPAEMTTDEYLRDSARATVESGAAAAQADREVGTRYLSAAIESAPDGRGRDLLLVTGAAVDSAGTPSEVVSVFVWEDGRWGYDPEASRTRRSPAPK
jgi:hypothetical protein